MKRSLVLAVLCLCALVVLGCTRPKPTPAPPTEQPQPVGATEPVATRPSTDAPVPTVKPTVNPNEGGGHIVALDAGHGGEDLGARHFTRQKQMDFHESTITLQLALRIGDKLKARGFRVFYTRDGDYYPDREEKDVDGDGQFTPRDDLLVRTHLVNQAGAELFLSLHMNAWETKDEELLRATGGTETYYCPDRPFGTDNLRFANLVHKEVLATLARLGDEVSDRGVMIDHLPPDPRHMIALGPKNDTIKEATQMPGVLSEPMFITCDREAAIMVREDAQDALAEAYVNAIVAFFEGKG